MILSLDVGFRSMGWAIFNKGELFHCGVIKTSPAGKKANVRMSTQYFDQTAQITTGLTEIIWQHEIKAIIGELPHGGAQSAKASSQMNMATAIVSVITTIYQLPTEWASPQEVKLALVGKKNATKDEMINEARYRFPHFSFPKAKTRMEHIADAIGAFLALRHTNIVKMFCLPSAAKLIKRKP
jgi:Holliday junction resolvasome RuvABC endonuclease subunit